MRQIRERLAFCLLARTVGRGDAQSVYLARCVLKLVSQCWVCIRMKWPLHVKVGAVSVGHIQLSIDEHRPAGLDAAGTLCVGRNEPVDRSVDKCPFGVVKENGHIFRLRILGFPGLRRCDALCDCESCRCSHLQKIPPVIARSSTHAVLPPELHDRAAPRRLPWSELRVSPPLGGLGRAWEFHRILAMSNRASGYRWSP